MSNYIPHYTKKIEILHKKTEFLRRLISRGVEREKLLDAAEDVRLARIRALKAEMAKSPRLTSRDECREWAVRIECKISALEKMDAATILAGFA